MVETILSDQLTHHNVAMHDNLYVLIDANATAGASDLCHVGPREDTPSCSTPYFRDFLHQHGLGLPATFEVHEGMSETWTTPDGQHKSRIDHVAVPLHQCGQCVFSAVLDTFDLCNLEDHLPVGLQLTWQMHVQTLKQRETRTRKFAREAIRHGDFTASLRSYQVPDWSCDIEQHVHHYNTSLMKTLNDYCPKHKHSPKKSYITDEIWMLRDQKLAYKAKLRELHARVRRHALHSCFLQWRGDDYGEEKDLEHFQYHTTLLCGGLKVTSQLRTTATRLKRQLMRARMVFLKQHLDSLPQDVTAGQILQITKQIAGPTNPKKQISSVYPAVKNEDGVVCTSPSQAADRWIQFFSEMEGGVRCTMQELHASWRQHLGQFQHQHLSLALQDLPSLCDLERAFARVAAGKDIGQDGLPPELCRTHPSELARMSYSRIVNF